MFGEACFVILITAYTSILPMPLPVENPNQVYVNKYSISSMYSDANFKNKTVVVTAKGNYTVNETPAQIVSMKCEE